MAKAPLVQHFDLIAQAPGGVARLRELILTLAVQGKLVPQDPSDEPVSVLLQKIRAEKDRLIAEGKIKRDKPLAEIADEEKSFELPSGWEWVRFGEIAQHNSGKTLDKGRNSGVLRNYITTSNLYWGKFDLANVRQMQIRDDELERCTAQKGDLLICEGGEAGRAAVWDQDYEVCFQNHIHRARFFGDINPYYAYRIFEYLDATGEINNFRKGVGISNMSSKSLASIPLTLPPLAEQSRIVCRVEELMQLCCALEASGQLEAQQHAQLVGTLLGTLTQSETPEALADNWQRIATHFDLLLDRPEAVDALEQTILQLAVRGLLVPQDPSDEPASVLLQKIRTEKDHLIAQGQIKRDKPLPPITDEEKPFVLPQGWQWVRFDELIHPLKPIAYGVLVPGPDVETGVPFVRIADLSLDSPASKPEKAISPEIDAQFQRTRLEGGEILMGVVGSIGKLGVAPATWAGANIARAICRIVPADSGLNEFVLFLLQTKFMQESFAGDTRTLAQPTLNVGLIRAALTPLPPPEEQSRIVARVNELRSLCADLRQRLSAAQSTQGHLADALVAV